MLVAVTPGAVLPPLFPLLLLLLAPPLAPPLALLLLLPDDPHAATANTTAARTAKYPSDLVPRSLIPLLLHTVDPTGTGALVDAPTLIRYVFPQVFQILISVEGHRNTGGHNSRGERVAHRPAGPAG